MPIAPRAQVVESIFGLQLRNLLANATRLVEWRWGILFADTKCSAQTIISRSVLDRKQLQLTFLQTALTRNYVNDMRTIVYPKHVTGQLVWVPLKPCAGYFQNTESAASGLLKQWPYPTHGSLADQMRPVYKSSLTCWNDRGHVRSGVQFRTCISDMSSLVLRHSHW